MNRTTITVTPPLSDGGVAATRQPHVPLMSTSPSSDVIRVILADDHQVRAEKLEQQRRPKEHHCTTSAVTMPNMP